MTESEQIAAAVHTKWVSLAPTSLPAETAVVLWQEGPRTIYLEDAWGPAVPYGPVYRRDSESNFGYLRLKDNLEAVSSIPELRGWPDYAEFVRVVNGPNSHIESVGCAIGFFGVEGSHPFQHQIGSYLDIVFSDAGASQDLEAYFRLSATFAAAMRGCERWWMALNLGSSG